MPVAGPPIPNPCSSLSDPTCTPTSFRIESPAHHSPMNDATFESSEILLLNASTSLASFSSSSLDFFSAAR
jgi:hypothetical protein